MRPLAKLLVYVPRLLTSAFLCMLAWHGNIVGLRSLNELSCSILPHGRCWVAGAYARRRFGAAGRAAPPRSATNSAAGVRAGATLRSPRRVVAGWQPVVPSELSGSLSLRRDGEEGQEGEEEEDDEGRG